MLILVYIYYGWQNACVFNFQPVAKQGKKIHAIEYKIHLSLPKCILSEWSETAVHYGVKSMAHKKKDVLS